MTTRRVEDVAPQIRSLLAIGSASGLTDGQLLDRFAGGDSEASGLAFEALVDRHGPMVLRVCRGVLRDPHDAQDAFQATFLVLVRKAGSVRDRDSLASWLHGVALRVASHARAGLARRRRLERSAIERAEFPTAEEAGDDLGPRLHEEVGRLPERYRAAVVLCYLEGHTCEDAARVLNWPVGTVKSRLSRARERLRNRLTRLDPPLVFPPALSPRLARSTAELATRFGAGSSAPASGLGAVVLAEGVLKVMTLAKLKYPAFALLAAASWLGVSSALAPARAIQDPPKAEVGRDLQEKPQAQDPAPDPLARTVPRDLSAQAGSGTALVYALDTKGKRSRDGDGPWKEAEADLRWVAVVGVVDNQAVREGFAGNLYAISSVYPIYKRLDVQRQVRRPDGDWSDWGMVDQNKNYQVLDDLPEFARERMPEQVRPPALVDPLPVLKKGTWSGVDPKPVLRLQEPKPDKFAVGYRPFDRRLYASPLLAIRSLDFTVEPGTTYRYRVRVVLVNPDAAKDVKRELFGPWSEPTKEVTVR